MLASQSIEEPADSASQPLLARSMDILLNGDGSGQRQPVIDQRAALMIYTSGTTGRPKGELLAPLARVCSYLVHACAVQVPFCRGHRQHGKRP